jgi:hypothetical protein
MCADCGAIADTMLEMNGKPLCNECSKDALSGALTPEEEELRRNSRIYTLITLLRDADKVHAPKLITDIWFGIKPTHVQVNLGKRENYYCIKLDNGGEIVLNEQESLNCTKFRMDYQRITGILLPNLPHTKWACLLTEWLKGRTQGDALEEMSEQQEIIDAVIEHITSSRLIKGTGASIFGTIYYHEDAVLVPNDTIRNIAVKINRNLRLRRVSNILEDYLLGTTKTYRTVDGVVRMWRFSPAKVGLTEADAIEMGDQDD